MKDASGGTNRFRGGSMRRRSILLVLTLVCLSTITTEARNITLNNVQSQVYFSPNGGCTKAIVEALGNAKSDVLVQAYSFTSKEIAKALAEAHKRGVRITVILDKSNRTGKYSAADFTAHLGIPTFIDAAHAIAHNKIMIIDNEVVITGSFNFTKAAEQKNAENLVILKSKEFAKVYIDNWNKHREHSERYEGR
jgi:phosphatidylserine/phosphatidylglycerophosphate/cardiolipin synthase-like enzyme